MSILKHMRDNVWLYSLLGTIIILILYLSIVYFYEFNYLYRSSSAAVKSEIFTNFKIEEIYEINFENNDFQNKHKDKPIKIIFEGKEFSKSDSELLKKIPNLKSIVFIDSDINNELLLELRQLAALRELIIKDNYNFNNKAMFAISQLDLLEKLTISNTNVSDFVIPMKKLLHLDLSNNLIDDEGLKNFKHMTNLVSLNLADNKFTDKGLKFLDEMKNLSEIDLSQNIEITSMGIKYLINNPSLQSLNISDTKANVLWYDELVKLPNLKKLNISKSVTDYVTMTDLVEISSLEELDLSYTKQTALSLSNLDKLQRLKKLNISYTNIGNEELIEIIDAVKYTLNELIIDEDLSKELNLSTVPSTIYINILPGKGI